MSIKNLLIATAAAMAFAAAIFIAVRPDNQRVEFAMPMTLKNR